MKAIAWIIAAIIVVWYFATRGSAGAGASISNFFGGGTSGGIDTGGTASPGGSLIPLGTVSNPSGAYSHGSPSAGTSGGLMSRNPGASSAGNTPTQLGAPTGAGFTRSTVGLFGNQINSRVGSTVQVASVSVPSVSTARAYYLPPAAPTAPIYSNRKFF